MKPIILALALLTIATLQSVAAVWAADETFDRIRYGGEWYDKLREVAYWGVAFVTVGDFKYGSGDAEALRLVKRQEGSIGDIVNAEVQQHFMKEFRRLFGDRPFHDLEEGRRERYDKAWKEWDGAKMAAGAFWDRFQAAEEARRRALYGGRAGAMYCHVQVKRQSFPVLYEARCSMSAEDDLHYNSSEEAKDLSFSAPEHIVSEIKQVLTELLKQKNDEFTKIRKYSRQ